MSFFKILFMGKQLLWAGLAVFYILNTCFILPVKQKEIIEKLMTEGSFEKALSTIETLRETDIHDADVLLLKGICYYKIESHKTQAVPTLLNALAMSQSKNTDIDITYHLAQAYIANRDYSNAIKNYERLQKMVPEKFRNFHKKIGIQIDLCKARLEPPKEDMKLRETDSLFPSKDSIPTGTGITDQGDSIPKQYTIQICTMSFPLSDSFFKGQYGVKLIKMGDLYRYIYNIYPSVEEARAALPTIRKIYPDAFIREYDEQKLGKAIDMNMDQIK